MFFGDFSPKKQEKTSEENSVLSYSLKLIDTWTLVDSLRGYLNFVFFGSFFPQLSSAHRTQKLGEIHKRRKMATVFFLQIWIWGEKAKAQYKLS